MPPGFVRSIQGLYENMARARNAVTLDGAILVPSEQALLVRAFPFFTYGSSLR